MTQDNPYPAHEEQGQLMLAYVGGLEQAGYATALVEEFNHLQVRLKRAEEALQKIMPYPHHMLLDTATMPKAYALSKWEDIPEDVTPQIVFNIPMSLHTYLAVKQVLQEVGLYE